jgi:hypothetical protein
VAIEATPTFFDSLGQPHAWAAHSDPTDAGPLGQMPVAHQSPAAIIGELVGMAAEHARNLSLNGLRRKRSRALAQNLAQRIGKSSWLRESEKISVGQSVSLLCWRSGGIEHPRHTPPYLFTPSPTFAHSSWVSLEDGTRQGHAEVELCGRQRLWPSRGDVGQRLAPPPRERAHRSVGAKPDPTVDGHESPASYVDVMLRGIVGFQSPTRLEGK